MSATIYELDSNCTPRVSPCQAPFAAPHLSISPRNPALFVNNHIITISLVQLIQGVLNNARLCTGLSRLSCQIGDMSVELGKLRSEVDQLKTEMAHVRAWMPWHS